MNTKFSLQQSRNKSKPEKRIYADDMRHNPTHSEKILWEELRLRKLGVKFRRQCIVTGWIVDFYCPELKLIIEVDGGYHESKTGHDAYRDAKMKGLGLNIIRIKNEEVLGNLQTVLDNLRGYIKSVKG